MANEKIVDYYNDILQNFGGEIGGMIIYECDADRITYNDGGPAFPTPYIGSEKGMSLRDYFAVKALSVAQYGCAPAHASVPFVMEANYPDLARHAYAIADAMIAHRDK